AAPGCPMPVVSPGMVGAPDGPGMPGAHGWHGAGGGPNSGRHWAHSGVATASDTRAARRRRGVGRMTNSLIPVQRVAFADCPCSYRGAGRAEYNDSAYLAG